MLKRVFFLILTALGNASMTLAAGDVELRILASSHCTPPSVIERFERQNNIRLRFEYFESPAVLDSYLQSTPRGDLALVRNHFVRPLFENGQIARLDPVLLPNLKNLDPRACGQASDSDQLFSVPYIQGTIGIIFRSDLLGPEKPLWYYVFGWETGSIPFSLPNHYRDTMGTALIHLGFSYNSTSPATIGQAAEVIRALTGHPAFMGFLDSDETLRYLRENFIYVAVTYNNLAAQAMAGNPNLDFAVPAGAGVAWSFNYVLNSRSQKAEAAHKWLNYLMEPEVAAEVSAWNLATTPNLAARPLLPPEIRDNPVLYPPEAVWREAEAPRDLGPASDSLFIEHWSRLKQ